MIDKFYVLPYGCYNSLRSTDFITVLLITDDPILYRENIPVNDALYNIVGETTELADRGVEYVVEGVLIFKGQVFATTLSYEDTVNNKLLRTYNTSGGTLELLENYEEEGFFIKEYIDIPYTKLASRLIDDIIDYIGTRTTYKHKKDLKAAVTFREKVYKLSCMLRSNGLSQIHVVGENRTEFYHKLVSRFLELEGVKNGKRIYSNWDMAQENIMLTPYITKTTTDTRFLCQYLTEHLADILTDLHEYRDPDGKLHKNIIKIGSGNYYDTINQVEFNEGEYNDLNTSN